ncbi:LysR substrate-binding domain-containing protein [Humibacter antri]
MELRLMSTFVAVADELNYSRAALALHMTQPAVSQRIMQLERELGFPLFERTSRGLRLTAPGAAFLPECRRTLDAAERAVRVARNAVGSDVGLVRVGFAGALSAPTVSTLARGVRERAPGIDLSFASGLTSDGVIDRLAADELDIGFTAAGRTARGIDSRTLTSDPLALVFARDDPRSTAADARLAEFADAPFVMVDARAGLRLRDVAHEACLKAGFGPRIVQEASDMQTVLALVAAGVGVTLLPRRLVAPESEMLAIRPLTDVDCRLVTIVAWQREHVVGAPRIVLDVIDEHFREIE